MSGSLWNAWSLEPSVLVGCAGLVAARAAADRFRPAPGWALFLGGTALLVLALTSPLDRLADEYSFAAHMAQHMVLILVVPPLWILGAPAPWLRRVLQRNALARIERAVRVPGVAWGVATAALLAWHVPRLYDAAVGSEALHVVEHLCLLVAFTIYWWPALTPVAERRLAPGPTILHLAAGAAMTSALGILVTFSGPERYRAYAAPEDSLHLLAALRAAGLDRGADLALSGLLMWMAGTPVFLVAALDAIRRWCREAWADGAPAVHGHD